MEELRIEHEEELTSFQKSLALLISLTTFAISFSVLIGWHIGSAWLISAYPRLPTMAYDSAVLFFLASFALGFAALNYKKASMAMCFVVIFLSTLSILEGINHSDLGLQDLLLEPSFIYKPGFINQLSPYTACCFILFCLGLLSTQYKVFSLPHIWMPGLVSTLVIMICLIGLYNYGRNVQLSQEIYMGAYTLLGLIFLCIGLLLSATSLAKKTPSKSIQLWLSVLITLGILSMFTIFYLSFMFEQRQALQRDIRYEAGEIFQFVAGRVSEVVNAMKRAQVRYNLGGAALDDLWEADAKSYLNSLAGFRGMILYDHNHMILKENIRDDFAVEEATQVMLPQLKNSTGHYFSIRTAKGKQIFVVHYPIKEHKTFVALFDVDALIQLPYSPESMTKFDLLILYGKTLLCNTFMYSFFDKTKTYLPLYNEKMIGGQKFEAYMWGLATSPGSYYQLLPFVLLACGSLFSILVGFLFYLIQKFKSLGEDLNRANNAKTMFLANVSHEVRTPLHGIIGTISMMKNLDMPAKESRYVQIIGSSAQHLLNLINNLLDLTRVESNSFNLVPQVCDVKQTIEEALQFLTIKTDEKKLKLEFYFVQDPSIKGVKVPTQALTQIVINLVGNATKFTDQGKIIVSVNIKDLGDNALMDLTIKDTGIGIPEDRQEHIFEKFAQLSDSPTKKRGGTGLGLFLTKSLVEQMGGKIRFSSVVDQGTTFYVQLPVEKEA